MTAFSLYPTFVTIASYSALVYPSKLCSDKNPNKAKPFDFFNVDAGKGIIKTAQGTRLAHGYLSPCGDAFAENNEEYLPEGLLVEYAKQGVHALWWHGVLSTLSPYPFDEKLSQGYQQRREEMKRLIARLKKYGIKLYLYINEPRALPVDKIGRYGHLIGRKENGFGCLCLEQKETQEYFFIHYSTTLGGERQ